ncbi:MAG: hypothetical protein AAGB31_03375 [Bdellovibrio sp.]
MKKNILAAIAMTFSAASAMAGTLNCTVSEIIGGSLFRKEVVVQDNSTEFVTTAAATAKGFIAYAGGYAVINFTDVTTNKTSYIVQAVQEGGSAVLNIPIAANAEPIKLEVVCLAK